MSITSPKRALRAVLVDVGKRLDEMGPRLRQLSERLPRLLRDESLGDPTARAAIAEVERELMEIEETIALLQATVADAERQVAEAEQGQGAAA